MHSPATRRDAFILAESRQRQMQTLQHIEEFHPKEIERGLQPIAMHYICNGSTVKFEPPYKRTEFVNALKAYCKYAQWHVKKDIAGQIIQCYWTAPASAAVQITDLLTYWFQTPVYTPIETMNIPQIISIEQAETVH